jgi:hypothetical protein
VGKPGYHLTTDLADNRELPDASLVPGPGALLLHDSTVARFDAISLDRLCASRANPHGRADSG